MPASATLRIDGLVKRYGTQTVVDGISLSVAPGECFALLGPNGAGKTTTLRCALGLALPDDGHITLCDEPVPERAREARMHTGVVPQFDNLDPDFSCAENLIVFGRYFGLNRATMAARVPELLAFAGLESKAEATINTLSGGMKRRLTLARALVNRPRLLVLDEPSTGLDPQARHLIWERLRRLTAAGTSVLLTTHFMDEAERLAHRLAIMDHGRVLAIGTPREVIAAHIEPEVVEVYGDWPGGIEAWARAHGQPLSQRCELSAETAFCYTDDAVRLLAHLADAPGLRYLHRPANLEDVFLKLTGRDLRD